MPQRPYDMNIHFPRLNHAYMVSHVKWRKQQKISLLFPSRTQTQLTHFVAIAPVPIPHKTKPCSHGNDWPKEHWPFGGVDLLGCSKLTKDPSHTLIKPTRTEKLVQTMVVTSGQIGSFISNLGNLDHKRKYEEIKGNRRTITFTVAHQISGMLRCRSVPEAATAIFMFKKNFSAKGQGPSPWCRTVW